MKISMKELKPVIVLGIICIVVAALLGAVNMMTAQKIEDQQKAEAAAAMKVVLPGGGDYEELVIDEKYPSAITNGYKFDIGYVFQMTVSGNKPGLVVMCGVDNDGKIVGVEVISDDETPGYKEKIFDIVVGTDGKYSGEDGDSLSAEIVTGATKSSKGIYNAVKAALDGYKVANGGTLDGDSDGEPEFDNGGVSTRTEAEIIAVAKELMPAEYESAQRDGLPTSVKVYSAAGGGYAIHITTKTEWRPIEVDAVVTVDGLGNITGIKMLEWVVGYDPELLDAPPPCDEDFLNSIVGKNASGLSRVDLVTHATNTSNNLLDPLRQTLEVLYPAPVYSIIGWVLVAAVAVFAIGFAVVIKVRRRNKK